MRYRYLMSAKQAASLRRVLGLTQGEMAMLLGIEEKTVTRLESDAPWTKPMSRLLRLIRATPVAATEKVLRTLLSDDIPDARLGEAESQVLGKALAVVRTRLADHPRLCEMALGEIADRHARPDEWVYWATGARASREETRRLVDDEGIICRPLKTADAKLAPYLRDLRPGDQILLCHNGRPLAWYRLERQSQKVPDVETRELPPVFRWVPVDSALGERLRRSNYRAHDGTQPDDLRRGAFSCLAVRPIDRPLEVPEPRRHGINHTMTPFLRRAPDSGRATR